ncbi:MAG: YIP1 family protein [Acidobacteriaceae bacterium]|jgi:hypothetical protein|nr:YIP1 family protein [Acidobacteriaceae bacterium]
MDLKTRATNMVTKPADEWRVVATESHTVNDLMTGYVLPLAVIPAVCGFIGQTVIGVSVPLVGTIRVGMVRGLVSAIMQIVIALVTCYLSAMVVEKLAPTFQSRGTTVDALKLVVFAMTPVWLAGVLNIIPVLGLLAIFAGFYAVYVFYLGLPVIMNTPQPQVIPYMVVSALVIIVLSAILGFISAAVLGGAAYTTL